jgi:CheY-like chemotaxis protein
MDSRKVMIVEDEGIVSIDIRNILNRLGFTVSGVAFSGEEAIEILQESGPDLILMDIGLKGDIDGIEAAKIIKTNHNIPVIFLTGFADENTLARAKEADPAGYIIKPINEEELEAALNKALI